MDFSSYKRHIETLAQEASGKTAVYICTPDGEIKINEAERMQAASVIKVPIVMAGLHASDQGMLDLNKKVVVQDKVAGTGVLNYLSGNMELSILNMMTLALIVSDNTASNLLIHEIGRENINAFCQKAGASQTVLGRYFMDHEAMKRGIDNYTSAGDMIRFFRLIGHENKLLSNESRKVIYQMLENQQFREKLAAHQAMFHDKVSIANKTGELNGIQHDVGMFTFENRQVYAAILSSNWNNNYQGREFISQIGKLTIEYMTATE
ncbi:serine hydrolase [Siminovitchia sp. FSL H7-0308]|uniref:Beta-lactamase class A n=1 Tax=Siminovitchia thermophila TaxID=1245522 RepID=A0ABS2R3P8_9BACI|nr:serine hydrolase [Siminovitchia thermophila]MBM7714035.1 beta-lactamase class A [Siminovitchia thermophila]